MVWCWCNYAFVVICTCVVYFLCDIDSLPVGQTSIDWCSCGRGQRRVKGIDVKAHVDRSLFSVQDGNKVKIKFISMMSILNLKYNGSFILKCSWEYQLILEVTLGHTLTKDGQKWPPWPFGCQVCQYPSWWSTGCPGSSGFGCNAA